MEIIRPLENKKSEKVKSWGQIRKEANDLHEFLKAKKFEGNWTDAFAISHVQVSRHPKNFFVVHESKVKEFGGWCIVNLKILKKEDPCTFPEGCMSFPFRTTKHVNRFAKIRVRYLTPFLNLFLIPHWKSFKDLNAFICQHEDDHAQGKNIYGL